MGQIEQKINKNDFLKMISKKNNIKKSTVKQVYDAIIDQIKESVCEGKVISLTGFGRFSLRTHKGHHVQFEAKSEKVNDYIVLKFVASDVLMSSIRESPHVCADEDE